MTRGKAILITNTKQYETIEFNGDMYIETGSPGEAMFELLNWVTTAEDFYQLIEKFNIDNFGYPEQLIYETKKLAKLRFSERTYYDRWFSDYLYFLNVSAKDIPVRDRRGYCCPLESNMVMVFNFGKFKTCLYRDFDLMPQSIKVDNN